MMIMMEFQILWKELIPMEMISLMMMLMGTVYPITQILIVTMMDVRIVRKLDIFLEHLQLLWMLKVEGLMTTRDQLRLELMLILQAIHFQTLMEILLETIQRMDPQQLLVMLKAIIVPPGTIQLQPLTLLFQESILEPYLLLEHLLLHLQGLCFQILVREQLTFRPQHQTHIQSLLIQIQAGVPPR